MTYPEKLCFAGAAHLLGEIVQEAPSILEPVVVGDTCEEGIRGRFVLIQRGSGKRQGREMFNNLTTGASMWLEKVLVNHTETGKTWAIMTVISLH